MVLSSCLGDKEPVPELDTEPTLIVQSTNLVFGIGEAPTFNFINDYLRQAYYNTCSSLEQPFYAIERFTGINWEHYDNGQVCDAFLSGCCAIIEPNTTTLFGFPNLHWFTSGTYRYIFSVGFMDPRTERKDTYSNDFIIIR